MFSTTRPSSVVCPVGGGGLGQWDGDSLSSWNMWVIKPIGKDGAQPVRVNKQGK